MPLNKSQTKALKLLRKRLSLKEESSTCAVFSPAFMSKNECCEATRKSLEDGMDRYLRTWVIPLLNHMIEGDTEMLQYLTRGESV